LVRRNIMRWIMIDALERNRADSREDRRTGGWSAVAAAWAVLLIFLLLLAGVSAVACPRADAGMHRHFAAAVIPQHDPCVGAGLSSAPDVDGCKVIPLGRNWAGYANYW
jgi:hypothetical protein